MKNSTSTLNVRDYKEGTVYLLQFAGTDQMSSISPFCIVVEAFLRANNIKFERVDTKSARGKNGKLPMIEYNGEQICDSQIILRRLKEKFNIKESDDPRTVAYIHNVHRAIDLQTFSLLYYFKAEFLEPYIKMMLPSVAPSFLAKAGGSVAKSHIRKKVTNSFGSFTEEEFKELLRNDLTQLQNILGEQSFLFGDKPTTADCALFGQISTTYYFAPKACYPCELLDSPEYKPLLAWLERMKETLFHGEFHK